MNFSFNAKSLLRLSSKKKYRDPNNLRSTTTVSLALHLLRCFEDCRFLAVDILHVSIPKNQQIAPSAFLYFNLESDIDIQKKKRYNIDIQKKTVPKCELN